LLLEETTPETESTAHVAKAALPLDPETGRRRITPREHRGPGQHPLGIKFDIIIAIQVILCLFKKDLLLDKGMQSTPMVVYGVWLLCPHKTHNDEKCNGF
jgi:hypothetical protein